MRNVFEKVNPSKDSPGLLVLDGGNSHVSDMDIINLARANYVTIIESLPLYSTHKKQLLNTPVMATLETYFDEEIRQNRLTKSPVTIYDMRVLF